MADPELLIDTYCRICGAFHPARRMPDGTLQDVSVCPEAEAWIFDKHDDDDDHP